MVPTDPIIFAKISEAKQQLDTAREHGDLLRVDLEEAALNSLLDELNGYPAEEYEDYPTAA